MAIHVDLSATDLNASAVTSFIKDHTVQRPAQDILFKVTPEVFDLVCVARHSSGGVAVSEQELAELNSFLKSSWTTNDFRMRAPIACSNCGRTLTFYDFFHSGRKRHGDEFVSKYLLGGNFVHVQRRGQALDLVCTACGTANVIIEAGYDGPQY
ncbi:MAG TPA: hypothetical protein VN905_04790 [Candidatus Binatia bacterium]|nr:hypothetical protein [Candidatus Binatia bacterium]